MTLYSEEQVAFTNAEKSSVVRTQNNGKVLGSETKGRLESKQILRTLLRILVFILRAMEGRERGSLSMITFAFRLLWLYVGNELEEAS